MSHHDQLCEQRKGSAICACRDRALLGAALTLAVKLSNHYAILLNMYDGGERRPLSPVQWIERAGRELRAHEGSVPVTGSVN